MLRKCIVVLILCVYSIVFIHYGLSNRPQPKRKSFVVDVLTERGPVMTLIHSTSLPLMNVTELEVHVTAPKENVTIPTIKNDTIHLKKGKKAYTIEAPYPSRSIREKGSQVWDYSGCTNPRQLSRLDFWSVNDTSVDVTLVTASSFNRLVTYPILLSRWKGPICLVMHLKEEEVSSYSSYLQKSPELCSERVTLIVYISSKGSFYHENYPINTLRNLGIHHTRTTHYVYLDIDMWPSRDIPPGISHAEDSYSVMRTLAKVEGNDTTAVIVPAFFHNNWTIQNQTFTEQIHLWCWTSHVIDRMKDRVPSTIDELLTCVKKRRCISSKKGVFNHYYIRGNWVGSHLLKSKALYLNVPCWPNRYQEPYVMVRRRDGITDYFEEFINFGFNKISYIEHLRNVGYRFIIMRNAFAFDLPHVPSAFHMEQKKYVLSANTRTFILYNSRVTKNRTPNRLLLCKEMKMSLWDCLL